MIRRLRDEIDSPDPMLARAAALIASRPPLNTERMWGRPLPPLEPSRHRRPALRVALVLAISLASVVAGAATALPQGNWWAEPWTVVHALIGTATGADASRRLPAHSASAVDSHPGAVSAPLAAAAATAAAPIAEPVTALPSISVPPAPMPAREFLAPAAPLAAAAPPVRSAVANRAALPVRATNDSARNAGDGESALMLEAVRALRRDHEPTRALSLAETALDRYPHGTQVEEAMALGMEAANSAGDGATAHKLAERYLASFRAGRFADRAQQIVSGSLR